MILDTFLSFIAPIDCLQCGIDGGWLCPQCQKGSIESVPSRCFRCHQPTQSYATCEPCRHNSPLQCVLPAALYVGIIKQCIWHLKFSGAQSIVPLLTTMIPAFYEKNLIVVPVPTANTRRRQRGYDQAILLARSLAQQRKLEYAPVLRRHGTSEQLGASRLQRLQQLRTAYRCTNSTAIKDRHILLVDDVLTTGATLESAARVLLAAGADRVSAAVIAQA